MSCQYRLFVPKQAVGANLVYFDLFNNSTDKKLLIEYIHPVVSGAVAVVGVVGVDLFLTFTSAVGTGGTAATRDGTDLTAATFSRNNPISSPLDDGITARLTPTGGATAAGVIAWASVFTEETNAATYMGQMYQMFLNGHGVIVPKSRGIRVVQGAVASVGNIGFNVGFHLID